VTAPSEATHGAPAGVPGTRMWRGVIEEFRDRLDLPAGTPTITLREGGTPLVDSRWLSELTGAEVWLKVEGDNPTGSFKDRGMTVALSVAVGQGAEAVVCASTGNTSASMAAYAAKARVKPLVLVPQGKIAAGKLAQAIVHGAQVIMVRGNFDDCLRISRELSERYPVALVNSVNPMRLEGQKTASFEIVDVLGDAPDIHCLPVGNAGNISAYWLGYSEASGLPTAVKADCPGAPKYSTAKLTGSRPVMAGFQAAGAAPFLRGKPVDHPETVATAIRIGHPQSWDLAWAAQKESGGWFDELADDEILAAQKLLATQEGVFCEPASAASIAGALRHIRAGKIPATATVVCTLTGHGLKDPDIAMRDGLKGVVQVAAERRAVEQALKERM
jgi:threonine synthase